MNSVQYVLLVFTMFEVLERPIHEGHQLEMSNRNERYHEPRNISFSKEIFAGAINIVAQILAPLRYGSHAAEQHPGRAKY
jgi:hypothetical protein